MEVGAEGRRVAVRGRPRGAWECYARHAAGIVPERREHPIPAVPCSHAGCGSRWRCRCGASGLPPSAAVLLLAPALTHTYLPAMEGTRQPKPRPARKRGSPWSIGRRNVRPANAGVVAGRRYYSPGIGRWVNRDPIGESGGANLLLLAHNAPVGTWDLLGLTWYGTFPVPPGVFPVHYLGRSGGTLYFPPGTDFSNRIRATPCSANFELAAVTSVLDSIGYILKNQCCEPKTFTRTETTTAYVLPWHDADLFLAINRYTLSYRAEWTVDSRCCVKYTIKFEAYDIYDFSTFAKVMLVGVPWIGKPFRIEWDWERKGGKCP